MAKKPDTPKKPGKAPKSKAHRPEVQPIGPALAELLNPAINRGESGLGSGTGLQPPPDNSWDRRAGGEAAAHRARKSTRATGDDVARRDAVAKRDASVTPPSTRAARGGEGSGVGGGPTSTEPVDAPPTPDPSPPLRGGREAERAESADIRNNGSLTAPGFDEAPQANYGTAATI